MKFCSTFSCPCVIQIEQINADLNVLRIKREAVDAEVEVKVADEDAKNVPHDLNIPVDKNRSRFIK
jgi:hypothetical protein